MLLTGSFINCALSLCSQPFYVHFGLVKLKQLTLANKRYTNALFEACVETQLFEM